MSQHVNSWRGVKTYENAVRLLNSRRRQVRPNRPPSAEVLTNTPGYHDVTKDGSGTPTYRGTPSIKGMREWLQKLGYSDSDVAALNVVHVAGTKGKGSTCAFTRSLLQQWRKKTGFPRKIGLYTSPDLICIRERIQIDNAPISEEKFTRYFFEVWERLFVADREENDALVVAQEGRQPRFLQFMALLAFHVFVREGAQAAIFETHHGGEYDATNFTTKPVVTGITTIGVDHILQLGPTVENIAWHKAGIFKTGTPAFSAPQAQNVEEVLRKRAEEKCVDLKFIGTEPNLPSTESSIFADVQRTNCSLAIALANAFLSARSPSNFEGLSVDDIRNGVAEFSWPGRFETIEQGSVRYFIDGAHNELSIQQAASWFAKVTKASRSNGNMDNPRPTAIIFSQLSEERDVGGLLQVLADTLSANALMPDHTIFTSYQERQDGRMRLDRNSKTFNTTSQVMLQAQHDTWQQAYPQTMIRSEPSIEEALAHVQYLAARSEGLDVLVTGSLHLVGGALYLLRGSAVLED